MNKTKLLIIFYIELVVLLVVNNGTKIDFKIDTTSIPTLPTSATPEVEVYEDSNNTAESSVDMNKIYYHQRLAYAQSLLNSSTNTKADTKTDTKTEQSTQQTTATQQTTKRKVIDTTQYRYLINQADTWLGVPYVWGGTTRQGADCSGFIQQLYLSIGVSLPRTSKEMSTRGLLVSRDSLLPGDLLFFDTTNPRDETDITTPTQEMLDAQQVEDGYIPNKVSHVGLYVGNGQMIHAASGAGYVKYENIETYYYRTRFLNARRILIPKEKEE